VANLERMKELTCEGSIHKKITVDLGLDADSVLQAVELLDEGNTVPFIARYRKEATGGMTDENLRQLHEKLHVYRNFFKRRNDILRILAEKEILTQELEALIKGAKNLAQLEDIYRPYKPKKRTQAGIAREKGLEPLAEKILKGKLKSSEEASEFLNDDVTTAEEALNGAKYIISEIISDDHNVRQMLRSFINKEGEIISQSKEKDPGNYEMYSDFQEPILKIQPHRILALNRGEKEGYLKVEINISEDKALVIIKELYMHGDHNDFCSNLIQSSIKDSWRRLLFPSLEREVRSSLTEKAEKL